MKAEACHLCLDLVMNLIVLYVFEGLCASQCDMPGYFTEEDKILKNYLKEEVPLIFTLLPYLNCIYSHIFYAITLMVTGGKLWWADEESAQLGTVTKRDGRNPVILRNKTSGVVHMKVYDREGQKGKQAHTYMNTQIMLQKHTLTTHTYGTLLLAFCCLCLTFRKKPVPDKQRRVLTALLPHL